VLAGLLLPVGEGLTRTGLISLSILVLAIFLWASETVHATVTALVVLVLLPTLGALSYADSFVGLGQFTIWRLVGILILTMGLTRSGLDKRLALGVLKLARGNVYAMFVLMVLSAQLLVFILPVPTARTSLLAATYFGILQGLDVKPPSNIGKVIFLGISVSTLLTSASLITGASVEIYAVGLFSTLLNYHFSYVSWMVANLPITFLASFAVLLVLVRLFPPEKTRIEGADALVAKELAQLGPLNTAEKKMLVLFAALMVMWFTGISDQFPAEVMIATLLFMPGINLLTWSQAQKEGPWGIVILYGSSLSLALALQQNLVVKWAADLILSRIGMPAPPTAALLVVLLVTLVRLGMTNMTGVVVTLFPLVTTLAASTGLNPVWLGMICVVSSGTGFMFPSQSVTNLITYAFGYYSTKDMAWAGIWVLVVITAIMITLAMFYWPLVGLTITP
jgi:anion transporter